MLAQEEQNDPMPCALLFVGLRMISITTSLQICSDQLFLKIRDIVRPGKREELLDTRPPRKMIRQIEDLDNITKTTAVPPGDDQSDVVVTKLIRKVRRW